MPTLTINIDDSTARNLKEASERDGYELGEAAARYLKRALLLARPRPKYDIEKIRAANAEFIEEDRAFDDLDAEETVELLRRADEE